MEKLRFLNWEKHQPRKDIKKTHWFALSYDFFDDPKLSELELSEKGFAVFLLCHVGKYGKNGEIDLRKKYLSMKSGALMAQVNNTLKVLEIESIVEISNTIAVEKREHVAEITGNNTDAYGSVQIRTETCSTGQDRTEHTKHTEHTEHTKSTELEKVQSEPEVIADFSLHKSVASFLITGKISKKTQILWAETYEDINWINAEFVKMIIWLDANKPKRPKKSYARFIANWLNRGFENHRKSIPSSRQTFAEIKRDNVLKMENPYLPEGETLQ